MEVEMTTRSEHIETNEGNLAPDGAPEAGGDLSVALAAATLERDEQRAAYQRTAADFMNFRRRVAEEREREAGLAAEGLLLKVVGVVDDLDRAIAALPENLAKEAWVEGVTAIQRKMLALLESEEARPFESVGQPFDPREHEAIAQVPDSGKPPGQVLQEHRRGWRIRDRVLRPAVVSVAAD
ncbi:MAG: nucleotide exchange factor GrpE [Chloroflexota bacterium]|jgi:molecular chaperone GrpE